MFGGPSHAAFSGKSSLKKCKMKNKIDNAVIIDIDTDGFPDVIVIDEPEYSEQDLRSSGELREGKKVSQQSVISIDDDDDESVEEQMDIDSDASSSKKPSLFGKSRYDGTDSDFCEFVWERKHPVNLSNCKRTYSEKVPNGTRFGLCSESESRSSESDCSDCEVMEGSSGKLRDQWEKAFSNRKRNAGKSQSNPENQASTSGTTNGQSDVELENSCEQHPQVPINSSKGEPNNGNGNIFESIPTDDYGAAGGTSLDPEVEGSFAHFSSRFQFWENTFTETPPFRYNGSNLWSDQERDVRPDPTKNYMEKDQFNDGEPCFFNSDPYFNMSSREYRATGMDKEAASWKSQYQHGENGNNYKVTPGNENRGFYPENSGSRGHCPTECQSANDSSYVEEFLNAEPNATTVNCSKTVSGNKVGADSADSSFCRSTFQGPEVCNEKYVSEIKDPRSLEELSTDNNQQNATLSQDPEPLVDTPSSVQPEDENVTHTVEGCIITDREKLKETEEYKRATEEEWASRQRQLELQAEEIQKLRKRKKAEIMRLLDMERRQKQRLEEMRAIKKKDEENLNLKEQLRSQIRNELKGLEVTCFDMSSLLRGLGVSVEGGVHPLSNEVHAAYKRALLRFHPDRTSQASVRQQVEAEEKFKLISRMKEKF